MSDTPLSLPAPGDLERYERVLPGSAARILALAEERAARDSWLQTSLAREERLTRFMSFTAILLSITGTFAVFAVVAVKFALS